MDLVRPFAPCKCSFVDWLPPLKLIEGKWLDPFIEFASDCGLASNSPQKRQSEPRDSMPFTSTIKAVLMD
jgi:hypothetical protein